MCHDMLFIGMSPQIQRTFFSHWGECGRFSSTKTNSNPRQIREKGP